MVEPQEIKESAEALGMSVEDFVEVSKDPGARFQVGMLGLVNEAMEEGVGEFWLLDLVDEITAALIQRAADNGEFGEEFGDDGAALIHHMTVIHATAKGASRDVEQFELAENLTSTAKMVLDGVDLEKAVAETYWPTE